MKMIFCILQTSDRDNVAEALNKAGHQVTILPSTGAYFRRGNATMIAGVDDEKVESALQIIRDTVKDPDDPGQKRATLFVINVDQYHQV
ncbi:MAG: cyclic-di-AMP receptor [Anaerolineales bacterium]|nr:cyclic-di-AMP receptor [Anaerolineales bacterium]